MYGYLAESQKGGAVALQFICSSVTLHFISSSIILVHSVGKI